LFQKQSGIDAGYFVNNFYILFAIDGCFSRLWGFDGLLLLSGSGFMLSSFLCLSSNLTMYLGIFLAVFPNMFLQDEKGAKISYK